MVGGERDVGAGRGGEMHKGCDLLGAVAGKHVNLK